MSLGYVSAVNSGGRTIWIIDAHRNDGKRFVVHSCLTGSSRPRLCGGCCSGGGSIIYLLGRRARLLLRQCFALFRVIPDQVRNVRAWLRDFVVQHAPQNVAPYCTRHRNTNRNCRHLIPGQAVFQVFSDLFLSHNTFLLQYSRASDQASFVQNLPKCSLS